MYATGNPRTKKALKELVASGHPVRVFSPGPFPAPTNGTCVIEGPQAPQAHRWYAQATIINGIITSVK